MRLVRFFPFGMMLSLFVAAPAFAQKYVCMQSTQGEWCMELLREAAPNTVANFLRYVNSGAYSNNLIHRSAPGVFFFGGIFNVGDDNLIGTVASLGKINNEFSRSNVRGTVSMVLNDGEPNSATSQWFINVSNNSLLDEADYGRLTVFSQVVYGMDVVDKIAALGVQDLSNAFNNTIGQTHFGYVPLADFPANATQVERKNLVIITRTYATNLLPGTTAAPFHCTAAVANDALTELCDGLLNFPVQIDGGKYDVTLELIPGQAQLVFGVKAGSLKALAVPSASIASYVDATGEVLIPSVRVGAAIYDNVVLKLTNRSALQFTVQSFKQR
jgi:peptidyl-prolyl cis-trans isomerase A (cyclophilin A)